MLYTIWGFHGGGYEECRLLGYKNPVRTSQEKHYVSAIEPSWLMLYTIWGFHGGDYEECRVLGCYAYWKPTEDEIIFYNSAWFWIYLLFLNNSDGMNALMTNFMTYLWELHINRSFQPETGQQPSRRNGCKHTWIQFVKHLSCQIVTEIFIMFMYSIVLSCSEPYTCGQAYCCPLLNFSLWTNFPAVSHMNISHNHMKHIEFPVPQFNRDSVPHRSTGILQIFIEAVLSFSAPYSDTRGRFQNFETLS
jgi:hypothetical protein